MTTKHDFIVVTYRGTTGARRPEVVALSRAGPGIPYPSLRKDVCDDRRVGILCDYFAAPDDEIAASVLGIQGGSTMAPPPGYETVTLTNIEPVVNMQTLEELLSDRSPEEVTENPRQGKILVFEPDGPAIVAITAELQRALAAADEVTLGRVAAAWAETAELDGSDPDDLAESLLDLAALARAASARGHQLYCCLSA